MKATTFEQFVSNPTAFFDESQQEGLLVTREGRPLAVIIGIEDKDEEQLELENSPEFWEMIRHARSQPTISIEELKRGLFADSKDV